MYFFSTNKKFKNTMNKEVMYALHVVLKKIIYGLQLKIYTGM